eukprot:TRINITY_DN3704_c0_g1_i1.p1 TRINITY_DN3704_c0_g1~~TRINITY_DN3704_c0_g1_i1.p1  ORF type:complete len:1545 (+),score=298.01 TRINITY_DN3704_c0_g1_i1:716-5350(+)
MEPPRNRRTSAADTYFSRSPSTLRHSVSTSGSPGSSTASTPRSQSTKFDHSSYNAGQTLASVLNNPRLGKSGIYGNDSSWGWMFPGASGDSGDDGPPPAPPGSIPEVALSDFESYLSRHAEPYNRFMDVREHASWEESAQAGEVIGVRADSSGLGTPSGAGGGGVGGELGGNSSIFGRSDGAASSSESLTSADAIAALSTAAALAGEGASLGAAGRSQGEGLLACLREIPPLYFAEDFSLENGATFKAACPFTTVPANMMLQEKLSYYLDLVEVHLVKEISSRSDSFFEALGQLEDLHGRIFEACRQVQNLQEGVRLLDADLVEGATRIQVSSTRRDNLLALHQKMKLVSYVNHAISTLRLLVASADCAAALDVMDDMKRLLESEELAGLHCFRHVHAHISEAAESVNSLLQADLVREAIQDSSDLEPSQIVAAFHARSNHEPLEVASEMVTREALEADEMESGAGEDESGLREQILPIVIGLLRTSKLPAVLRTYRETLTTDVKAAIKSVTGELLPVLYTAPSDGREVLSSDPTSDGVQSSLAFKLRGLSADGFVHLLLAVFATVQVRLKRAAELRYLIEQIMGGLGDSYAAAAIAAAVASGAAAAAAEAEEAAPNHTAEASRRGRGGGTSVVDAALASATSAAMTPANVTKHFRADVLRENTEAVCAACDAAHMRWSKLLGVRSGVHSQQLKLHEFVAIYSMTSSFITYTEKVCGRLGYSIRATLQSQAKAFVDGQHGTRLTAISASLDQELWVPVDAPDEFQKIVDALLSSSTFADNPTSNGTVLSVNAFPHALNAAELRLPDSLSKSSSTPASATANGFAPAPTSAASLVATTNDEAVARGASEEQVSREEESHVEGEAALNMVSVVPTSTQGGAGEGADFDKSLSISSSGVFDRSVSAAEANGSGEADAQGATATTTTATTTTATMTAAATATEQKSNGMPNGDVVSEVINADGKLSTDDSRKDTQDDGAVTLANANGKKETPSANGPASKAGSLDAQIASSVPAPSLPSSQTPSPSPLPTASLSQEADASHSRVPESSNPIDPPTKNKAAATLSATEDIPVPVSDHPLALPTQPTNNADQLAPSQQSADASSSAESPYLPTAIVPESSPSSSADPAAAEEGSTVRETEEQGASEPAVRDPAVAVASSTESSEQAALTAPPPVESAPEKEAATVSASEKPVQAESAHPSVDTGRSPLPSSEGSTPASLAPASNPVPSSTPLPPVQASPVRQASAPLVTSPQLTAPGRAAAPRVNDGVEDKGTPVRVKKAAVPVKTVQVRGEGYHIVNSGLLMLKMLAEYIEIANALPALASEVVHRVAEILKTFNSRTCQLVLGAGAMQVSGLKSITAKHLAVSSQCISFFYALIGDIRRLLSVHIPDARKALVLTEIDRVGQDLRIHRDEVHSKLVAIMRERMLYHLKALSTMGEFWSKPDDNDKLASQFARALTKEVGVLQRILSPLLPDAALRSIFTRVVAAFHLQLADAFLKIDLVTPQAKRRVYRDVALILECLRGLPTNPSPQAAPGELEQFMAQKFHSQPPP